MAETTPNAFDRFNDTLRNLDDQIQELRERVEENGRQFRDDFRKRAEKVETQLRKSPLYRRAEQTRKDFESQVGKTRDQVYDTFGIASKAEIQKLSKKLNAISKKLNELSAKQLDAEDI